MAAPIAVAASLDLIGIPWAKAVSAASVPANERNPEELDTIARALCLCPCLLESSHAQRIEFARVCTTQRLAADQLVRHSDSSALS